MPRTVPLTAREATNAERVALVGIVLATITHPDLDAPVRISSDPTERISIDPLAYGTRSNGEAFYFILMSATHPDDQDGQPIAGQLILENVDADMVAVMRSFSEPASVDLDIVLSTAPDDIQISYRDLKITHADGDAEKVTLTISREPLTGEPWPAARMTKSRLPGLWR
jgi:hypothetical protein